MIVVASGLIDQVDSSAVTASIARIGVGCFLRELLNGIDGRKDHNSEAVVVFVVANSIQKQAVFLIAQACEGIG